MIRATIGNNVSRRPYTIDENTTLRQALEQAGIDYSIGMTSLDGTTLQPGDLDKSFAQFGITERCFLLNVVKADNAAKIKIVGNVAVVESDAKLETIKKLQKYRPDSLRLYKGTGKDKEEVYAICAAPKGNGSINEYGASFGTSATTDGKALITLMIPDGTRDAKEWVKETVGAAILNLNKVEAQFAAANEEIDNELAEIEANIAVM